MAPQGICPLCGRSSSREHSRYKRQLRDLPWQGWAVRLHLISKKYFCDSPGCTRRIFVARLPEVASAYARKTVRLVDTLANIAFTCGGEAGSRLANRLGMPTSADTLLRTIRKTPVSTPSTLRIVGVDDWAMRKGLRYGTLICDLEQHRPIDVLDDREPETVATWFRQHPEIEVVTRDRAHCYSEGVSQGAPQATQVADRFHLIQNLRKALSRMLEHHYPQMALACSTWPGIELREELESTDPGQYKVKGRLECKFSEHYFRAIAKIAFHYYLVRARRPYGGHEELFSPIRNFIINGGDRTEFFNDSGPKLELPFGESNSSIVFLPNKWFHLLAINEVKNEIVVCVYLFAGPLGIRKPHHVRLCSLKSPIVLPDRFNGHIYKYDDEVNNRYAGEVLPVVGIRW